MAKISMGSSIRCLRSPNVETLRRIPPQIGDGAGRVPGRFDRDVKRCTHPRSVSGYATIDCCGTMPDAVISRKDSAVSFPCGNRCASADVPTKRRAREAGHFAMPVPRLKSIGKYENVSGREQWTIKHRGVIGRAIYRRSAAGIPASSGHQTCHVRRTWRTTRRTGDDRPIR